jgi:glutathione S-transferase
MRVELIIGTKKWSSWSLRAWLAAKRCGLPFTETLIELHSDAAQPEILKHSPSGTVPALRDGELLIWDSLAICEYLHERAPQAKLWPDDPAKRAVGRSAVAEMHSGFRSLRGELAMDLTLRKTLTLTPITEADVRRMVQLWLDLRSRFAADGPFLLGQWSIADAFFTPVATRFRTYDVALSNYGDTGDAGRYAAEVLETPEFKEWEAAAVTGG